MDGWAFIRSSDGRVYTKRVGSPAGWIPYTMDLVSEDYDADSDHEVRVEVRLNMLKRTCSFTLNGVDLGVAWSSLPLKYYFPAVSFFSNSMYSLPQEQASAGADLGTTMVRVELLDGFEFEEDCSLPKRPRSSTGAPSGSPASSSDIYESDITNLGSSPGPTES
ncbi:hypothetical protein R1flu_026140 [Riccia fluitans]|uniref:Uncharacterized protein n=1 Tax=Riccia fluitans TaxID=41844 RepID=A0ABD1XF38_9MARC